MKFPLAVVLSLAIHLSVLTATDVWQLFEAQPSTRHRKHPEVAPSLEVNLTDRPSLVRSHAPITKIDDYGLSDQANTNEPSGTSTTPDAAVTTQYFRQADLSTPAVPLSSPDIPPPLETIEGTAVFVIFVSEDGSVAMVVNRYSDWPISYLDTVKLALRKTKFRPGTIFGKPAKTRFVIEVSTSLPPAIVERSRFEQDDLSQTGNSLQ